MSVEEKAARLLVEGRVLVLEAGYGRPARALVRGDHGEYEVTVRDGYVDCGCPAWKRHCSHATAVARVTDRDGTGHVS